MKFLFQGFLENPGVYREAQQFWERLFRSSLPFVYPESQLAINPFNNPDLDGNPIFTGVCRPLQLAMRIIQQPPGESGDLDLDWWVDFVGRGGGRYAIPELVLSCCLSEENLPRVAALLAGWFENGEVVAGDQATEDPWRSRAVRTEPELHLSTGRRR